MENKIYDFVKKTTPYGICLLWTSKRVLEIRVKTRIAGTAPPQINPSPFSWVKNTCAKPHMILNIPHVKPHTGFLSVSFPPME